MIRHAVSVGALLALALATSPSMAFERGGLDIADRQEQSIRRLSIPPLPSPSARFAYSDEQRFAAFEAHVNHISRVASASPSNTPTTETIRRLFEIARRYEREARHSLAVHESRRRNYEAQISSLLYDFWKTRHGLNDHRYEDEDSPAFHAWLELVGETDTVRRANQALDDLHHFVGNDYLRLHRIKRITNQLETLLVETGQ